jgi:hypothetical protein
MERVAGIEPASQAGRYDGCLRQIAGDGEGRCFLWFTAPRCLQMWQVQVWIEQRCLSDKLPLHPDKQGYSCALVSLDHSSKGWRLIRSGEASDRLGYRARFFGLVVTPPVSARPA